MKTSNLAGYMRLFASAAFLVFVLLGCSAVKQPQESEVSPPPETLEEAMPQRGGEVALVLPLSGPYAPIALQIRDGARAAVSVLAEQDINIQLFEIDTYSQEWTTQLKNLPASCTVIGGPLRPDAFDEISMAGINNDRVFFTFLQGMGAAIEGRDAWRFFSSPNDQIRTLLQMARREFGIQDVGVLYPNEPFGQRIAQLFHDNSTSEKVNVVSIMSYPPEDPLQWSGIVAELLYEQGQKQPIQAVFLPDVWSKVEMLVPYFFYHQREDLLIMGSTLWGQTLSESPNVDMHNFILSVFPGIWWSKSPVPATANLRRLIPDNQDPTVWQVLGYDFIRFFARLGIIPQDWDAVLVNNRIQKAQSMEWSMAPIFWDPVGIARQDMFLFTPTQDGMKPVDLQEMRIRMQNVKARMGGM